MPALQRSISMRGPHFYMSGETLMFVLHLDGSTQIGPRPANAEDKRNHPAALKAFQDRDPPSPFTPLVAFTTPEGVGPSQEEGEFAKRRRAAREHGQDA